MNRHRRFNEKPEEADKFARSMNGLNSGCALARSLLAALSAQCVRLQRLCYLRGEVRLFQGKKLICFNVLELQGVAQSKTLVDIGGSLGTLCIAVKKAHPNMVCTT